MTDNDSPLRQAPAKDVLRELGDADLAVLRALESRDVVDDAELASAARLSVSAAVASAHKLHELGLVSITIDQGRELFELHREKVQEQVATPSGALF